MNQEGLEITIKERGGKYHPYYAFGDFNADRKEDFAVALVNTRKNKDRFAVAVFNGPFGVNRTPAYYADGWDLSDGGLSGATA